MALQNTGAISLNDIHVEAGGTTGTQASINDEDIRGLISKGSGAQMSFSEWYGASAVTVPSANYLPIYQANASYQGTSKNNNNIFKAISYFNITGTNQTDWDFGGDLNPSNTQTPQPKIRDMIDDMGLRINGYSVPSVKQTTFNAGVSSQPEHYIVRNQTVTKFTSNNTAYRISLEFSTYLPNQMNQNNGFNTITSLGLDYLPTKVIPVNDANQNTNAFGGTNVNSSFGMFGWHSTSNSNRPIQMSVSKRVINGQHLVRWRFYYYLPQLQKAGNSTGSGNDSYTSMFNVLPNSATTFAMNEYKFYDFVSTSGLTFPTLTAPGNNYVTGITFYGQKDDGINSIATNMTPPTARST